MRPTIVISEFMDIPAVDRLRQNGEVDYRPELVDDRQALCQSLGRAQALIVRNRTQVDAALLAAAPKLQAVGRLGVGLDNIDTVLCKEKGIQVYPAVGANAQAVAEYVIATALILLRGAYVSSSAVVAGDWPRTQLSNGLEMHGRKLGLLGFGGIGQLVARLAGGLGMQTMAYDPFTPADSPVWQATGTIPLELEPLLRQSDVVSLHVPLTADTRHLLDARRLALLKPQAVLVNTSRGGIVDEAALVAALQQDRLRGAALDVFEDEPVKARNTLAVLPNLMLTPHIAGLTEEANQRVSELVADKILAYFQAR